MIEIHALMLSYSLNTHSSQAMSSTCIDVEALLCDHVQMYRCVRDSWNDRFCTTRVVLRLIDSICLCVVSIWRFHLFEVREVCFVTFSFLSRITSEGSVMAAETRIELSSSEYEMSVLSQCKRIEMLLVTSNTSSSSVEGNSH